MTFPAMDFRHEHDDEATPRQWRFLRWLARTYIPTWGTQEEDVIERFTCHDWFDSTEHEMNDSLTSRGDMTFRL